MLDFDPRDPAVMADPFPVLARLRREAPVHRSAALRGWVLTRYGDVRAALNDPRLSADRITPFMATLKPARRAQLSGLERMLTRWAVFVDPPTHTRLRGLLNKAFTPRAINALERAIATVVDELAAGFAGRSRIDLIADFAYPLPATVIAKILGVPVGDIGLFKSWSDDLAAFVGSAQSTPDKYERASIGIAEMDRYFRDLIRTRRAAARQDALIDALLLAEAHEALDEDELVATAVLLLFAGHETTTNLIGNGWIALSDFSGVAARLRTEPVRWPDAIEEMLRYDGPAASVTRVAREDIVIAGQSIKAGDRLFLMLNAANRDPDIFVEPDTFKLDRDAPQNLAFGYGLHYCIGAPLARLEARIAFARLLREPLVPVQGVLQWSDNLVLRGVKALPLSRSEHEAERDRGGP